MPYWGNIWSFEEIFDEAAPTMDGQSAPQIPQRLCQTLRRRGSTTEDLRREMSLHVDYCKTFGLSEDDITRTEEHSTCTAYSRYLLETGQSGDWLGLQTALAPCLLGYGMIAQRLYTEDYETREGNAYWKWVENYVAEDYVGAVRTGSGE
jgi:thiaminase